MCFSFALVAASAFLRPPLSALEYEKGSFAASLNGALEVSGVIPFDGETPSENPSALVVLEPRMDFGEHVSFYADLRGGYEGSQLSFS